MLSSQYLGLNVHFGVNLCAALVCFAVFWLILDAWMGRRNLHELLKWLGFLLLSAGFLLTAATVKDTTALSQTVAWLSVICKLAGLLGIVLGQLMDPLQCQPTVRQNEGIMSLADDAPVSAAKPRPRAKRSAKPRPAKTAPALAMIGWAAPVIGTIITLGAALVALLYWRRATAGLERHLKPVAYAFAAIAISELGASATNITSANPMVAQLLADYGSVWWLAQASLLIGSLVLGHWVWNYLTKRLLSQLFMILITQAVVIFLVSTVGFTYLTLNDVRSTQLTDLKTASRVLQYAVASRQSETIAQAQTAAATATLSTALANHNHAGVGAAIKDFYAEHQLSTLVITDYSGLVLWRGQDPDRWGDSRSGDPLVRRALIGQAAGDVMAVGGVVAPNVSLAAASPVRDASGLIVGTVTIARAVSNAFVDGIEHSTGLASTVYGGDTRAATTILTDAGRREIGVKETNVNVLDTVLTKGQTYTGDILMLNRQYLAAVSPLKDVDNRPVGMLQAARPASDLYTSANHSLQLTFLGAVILIIIAAYPLYRLARFVEEQLR